MPSTESVRYTKTAVALHWLIALAIIGMLILGWSLDDFAPENRGAAFMWHKSIGLCILLLSLLRLIWRLTHRAPAYPNTMPRWQQGAAHAVHVLLYTLMIAMPLSGWAMSSAGGHPVSFFGFFPWPDMPVLSGLDNHKAIAHALDQFHVTAAYVLAVLVGGHAAAALWHHFFQRDDVLLRMAPQHSVQLINRLRGRDK
jgi:cytochrome b561